MNKDDGAGCRAIHPYLYFSETEALEAYFCLLHVMR